MADPQKPVYKAEVADQLLMVRLDAMTLMYQRRSGITHIVAEPIPEILEMMRTDALNAEDVGKRLVTQFDLEPGDVEVVVASRLEEMAQLGLVERVRA